MRRTKVRRMRRWDVRYWGPGLTRARRHRPLSPHHSQTRQSHPPSRRHRGLRRGRKKVGHWCLGKLRVRMRTLMGRRIESRTWEIRVCPVGPFPCAFWASFEFWMMMRMRWDVLVRSSWFRAGFWDGPRMPLRNAKPAPQKILVFTVPYPSIIMGSTR